MNRRKFFSNGAFLGLGAFLSGVKLPKSKKPEKIINKWRIHELNSLKEDLDKNRRLSELIFERTPREFDKVQRGSLQNSTISLEECKRRAIDYINAMDLGNIQVFQELIDITKSTDK